MIERKTHISYFLTPPYFYRTPRSGKRPFLVR
jgi:hypothetical protein